MDRASSTGPSSTTPGGRPLQLPNEPLQASISSINYTSNNANNLHLTTSTEDGSPLVTNDNNTSIPHQSTTHSTTAADEGDVGVPPQILFSSYFQTHTEQAKRLLHIEEVIKNNPDISPYRNNSKPPPPSNKSSSSQAPFVQPEFPEPPLRYHDCPRGVKDVKIISASPSIWITEGSNIVTLLHRPCEYVCSGGSTPCQYGDEVLKYVAGIIILRNQRAVI